MEGDPQLRGVAHVHKIPEGWSHYDRMCMGFVLMIDSEQYSTEIENTICGLGPRSDISHAADAPYPADWELPVFRNQSRPQIGRCQEGMLLLSFFDRHFQFMLKLRLVYF